MGALGRGNVAVVTVRQAKLPADLLGITTIRADVSPDDNETVVIAEALAKWFFRVQKHHINAGQQLPLLAKQAVTACYNELLGDTIYGSSYLQFPLAAYPHFLRNLLRSPLFEMYAAEVIGANQSKAFTTAKPISFDHKGCHWYLYTEYPPNANGFLDYQKLDLLEITRSNPKFSRVMFLPAPQALPPRLALSLRTYFREFCKAKASSKLMTVISDPRMTQENQMLLSSDSEHFRAERLVNDDGRTLVAFRRMHQRARMPVPAQSVPAQDYLKQLENLLGE
jgi:hypothetical protein